MKKMIKGILIGFTSAIILMSTTVVYAQSINAELKRIIFKIDGKQVIDTTNGLSYNNELYLPATSLAKSLDYAFTFNPKTNVADLVKTNASVKKSQYKLSSIRFFESGYTTPDDKFRIYNSQFSKSTSRYISWEIELNSDVSTKDRNVKIEYIFYKPDGTVDGRETSKDNAFIFSKNSKSAIFSWGFGSINHGSWDAGTYKVELYVDGIKLATDSFKIIDDSNTKDERTKFIASAKVIAYKDVLRNTNNFMNKAVEFNGKVLAVDEISNSVHMYVNVGNSEDDYKFLSLSYTKKEGESKILVGDTIEFWGIVEGTEQMESNETKVEVPKINVKYYNTISEE